MSTPSSSTMQKRREDIMNRSLRPARQRRTTQRGQILVIAVLGMITMVGGVALLLEGGNAYAQQRAVQNGADAAANTGAGILGQRLGGTPRRMPTYTRPSMPAPQSTR
jgi:Flp pilus assembly protein TadG